LSVCIIQFALDIWRGNVMYPHPTLQAISMLVVIYAANYASLIRGGAHRPFDHEFANYLAEEENISSGRRACRDRNVVAAFLTLRGALKWAHSNRTWREA
jgi:hypothetical protein